MNIMEFLEARIVDDEAWIAGERKFTRPIPGALGLVFQPADDSEEVTRMVREVTAKRALIREVVELAQYGFGRYGYEGMVYDALRPMAEIYSDHPDFASLERD